MSSNPNTPNSLLPGFPQDGFGQNQLANPDQFGAPLPTELQMPLPGTEYVRDDERMAVAAQIGPVAVSYSLP